MTKEIYLIVFISPIFQEGYIVLFIHFCTILRDKTIDDKLIMINKITPAVDYNYWLKSLNITCLLNPIKT